MESTRRKISCKKKRLKPLQAKRRFCFSLRQDLQDSLGQIPVVLLGNLGAVRGPLEHGRVVVDVLDVDHHGRVVFLKVIRRGQPEFVLDLRGRGVKIVGA